MVHPFAEARRAWHGAAFLHALAQHVRNPSAAMVMRMERHMVKAAPPEEMQRVSALMRESSVTRELLQERWTPQPYTLSDLRHMPPNSLGYALFEHLLDNELDPAFFPEIGEEQDPEFLRLRSYQTHDIWHVLTGFGTSDAAETGIAGFYSAQYLTHLSHGGGELSAFTALLVGSMLLHGAMFRQDAVGSFFEHLVDGYQRGKGARCLVGVRWEERLEEPLAALRAEFGIDAAAPLADATAA